MGGRCSAAQDPVPPPRRRRGFLLAAAGQAEEESLGEIRRVVGRLSARPSPGSGPEGDPAGLPLLLEDDAFEALRRRLGRGERMKCGSQDFEASFCVCEEHWSNPGNERGLLDNSVLPNWIQIEGTFEKVLPGDYLVYWHVKYEQPEGLAEEGGKWAVSASCVSAAEVLSEASLCGDCALARAFRGSSPQRLRLTHLATGLQLEQQAHQWRRLALGVLEVRGRSSAVRTSFGWNPRWPRSFSLCHAGLLRLATPWEVKRVLLLGMVSRKQTHCRLPLLDNDILRLVLGYLR